jgi:hypothetical protein
MDRKGEEIEIGAEAVAVAVAGEEEATIIPTTLSQSRITSRPSRRTSRLTIYPLKRETRKRTSQNTAITAALKAGKKVEENEENTISMKRIINTISTKETTNTISTKKESQRSTIMLWSPMFEEVNSLSMEDSNTGRKGETEMDLTTNGKSETEMANGQNLKANES